MTRIKITIGICTKNSEKTIGEAIRSALCQDFFNDNVHGHSFENIEIIVVDACSKDKTITLYKTFYPKLGLSTFYFSIKVKD
jgi:glycosyltransferase involved in cell wall biosynthesis